MDDKYFILVNKTNAMKNDDEYKKVNCHSKYDASCTMEEKTYEAWLELKKFVLEQGYEIDVESGYRSKKSQSEVWDQLERELGLEYTKMYVAVPGYSEHQSGLAVDFTLFEEGKWYLDHSMKGKQIVDLVRDNAYKFGFVIRYPLGKEDITGYGYEPWHLRYINDPEVAKYILDNNLCLEEYLELKKERHI